MEIKSSWSSMNLRLNNIKFTERQHIFCAQYKINFFLQI